MACTAALAGDRPNPERGGLDLLAKAPEFGKQILEGRTGRGRVIAYHNEDVPALQPMRSRR